MGKKRKRISPQEKTAILREHLLNGIPVSDLCDRHSIHPTLFYRWQKGEHSPFVNTPHRTVAGV
ncbi:MAG: transposase [Magnetococcales bacterium]|nr:transposase [Magnetococcales bacterium]